MPSNEKSLESMLSVIHEKSIDYNLNTAPAEQELQKYLKLMAQIPMGHLRRPIKNFVFILHLAFYCDLKTAQLQQCSSEAYEILKDFLHFGQAVPVFRFLPAESLLQLLPPLSCWELYEFLYATLKVEDKATERFLLALVGLFENALQTEEKLSGEHIKLLLLSIESLAGISGPSAKRVRRYLDSFLSIYEKYVQDYFGSDAKTNNTSKKDAKFVRKTLAGFPAYVNAVIKKSKAGDAVDKSADTPKLGNVRICKIYIGHSVS